MEYVPILYFILAICKVENSVAQSLAIYPEKLNKLAEGVSRPLYWKFLDCSEEDANKTRNVSFELVEGYEENLDHPHTVYDIPCGYNETYGPSVNTTITGNIIGFVKFQVTDLSTDEEYREYAVGITRPPPMIQDKIFLFGTMILVILVNFSFGLTLDLEKVVKYLKKPIAPGIGLCCQFILMPVLGFLITLGMTTHDSLKLGLFATGVAPGGGLSNVWVFVVNGDVDLSITMTFISTIAALGFVPLWMLTLGQYILGPSDIKLPIVGMIQTLAMVVVPLAIGILINRFLPKAAKYLKYIQKPSIFLIMIFSIVMNIWANLYAFKMIFQEYQLVLVSMVLPYAGALFGFLIAFALRQGKKTALTIAIETAIQNGNASLLVLRLSLPQPWADISSSIPIVSIVFVMIPFFINVLIERIYFLYQRRRADRDSISSVKSNEKNETEDYELSEKTGVDNPAVIENDEGRASL